MKLLRLFLCASLLLTECSEFRNLTIEPIREPSSPSYSTLFIDQALSPAGLTATTSLDTSDKVELIEISEEEMHRLIKSKEVSELPRILDALAQYDLNYDIHLPFRQMISAAGVINVFVDQANDEKDPNHLTALRRLANLARRLRHGYDFDKVRDLARCLLKDEKTSVDELLSAISILSDINDEDSFPLIAQKLRHPDPMVRNLTASNLRKRLIIRDRQLLPYLWIALAEPNDTFWFRLKALGKEALPALLLTIETDHGWKAEAARRTVSYLDDGSLMENVEPSGPVTLFDKTTMVAISIISFVKRIGFVRVYAYFLSLLIRLSSRSIKNSRSFTLVAPAFIALANNMNPYVHKIVRRTQESLRLCSPLGMFPELYELAKVPMVVVYLLSEPIDKLFAPALNGIRESLVYGLEIPGAAEMISRWQKTIVAIAPGLAQALVERDEYMAWSVMPYMPPLEFDQAIEALAIHASKVSKLLLLAAMGIHNRDSAGGDAADIKHYPILAESLIVDYAAVRNDASEITRWVNHNEENLGLFLNGFFFFWDSIWDPDMLLLESLGPADDAPWREILWLALNLYSPEGRPIDLYLRAIPYSFGTGIAKWVGEWNDRHEVKITMRQALSGHPAAEPLLKTLKDDKLITIEDANRIRTHLYKQARRPPSFQQGLIPTSTHSQRAAA